MPLPPEQAADLERFFTAIKSLNELDNLAIRNVVGGMLGPTERERQFTLNYHRATLNIEFLLDAMKTTKQFQAITMVARSVLETAVELKLMAQDPDSTHKVSLFTEVEKLRTAKRMAGFKAKHPNANVETIAYEQFIMANEQRITHEKDQMWPGKKVKHWSLLSMESRCKHLGEPFEELYEFHYAHLSWYVHSGVTGVTNVQGETLSLLCGISFRLITECYAIILEAIINEFRFYKVDDKLNKKIALAKMLPFTSSQAEIDSITRVLLA